MIEATSTRSGQLRLIRSRRGSHQSSGLSEISSQFHDAISVVSGRLAIEIRPPSLSARRNLVLGPATLTTGCRPMVLVTTPPQPASNARSMLLSDSVGGAEASRNGLTNGIPVKRVDRSATGRIPPCAASRRGCGRRNGPALRAAGIGPVVTWQPGPDVASRPQPIRWGAPVPTRIPTTEDTTHGAPQARQDRP